MDKFKIEIPEFCVVALIGASSSGKTSFANRFFKSTEVLSSDCFRGMICDDENDQNISADAFDLLYYAANKRLNHMKLTVIDATNTQQIARKKIIDLAREQNVHTVAIVLNLPEEILQERNEARSNRSLNKNVIRKHCRDVNRSIKHLKHEGFRFVYVINSVQQLENVEIIRKKLWNNKNDEHGPFDIIGDIHGCCDELEMLLDKLGYVKKDGTYMHPKGRKAAFLGDFCDRGEKNVEVLKLVMNMVQTDNAIAVPGNHDVKLLKYLKGKKISIGHGIDKTIDEIEKQTDDFKTKLAEFIKGLVSHYTLDDGKLVITHAGLKQDYIGRGSAKVREFCLYGETTGEIDSYGLPVRLDWAADYRGRSTVVYGHIANKDVKVLNKTYGIDTGCVYGGKLTAYRYPENEIVSVDALKQYCVPIKPLNEIKDNNLDDMLTIDDINHKLHISTELIPSIDIQENNVAAALEIMSRFAADPHWLIYLPPTMSPCKTSDLDDYLEHPIQAFEYYRMHDVKNVICEKKHMGSRAVIVICKTPESTKKIFGISDGTIGIIYTRTGRRFFDDSKVENEILNRLNNILTQTNFWDDFNTEWVCLDTELMPWSEKAQGLIRSQYAPTGNAGICGLTDAVDVLEKTCQRENVAFDVDNITSGQNVDPHMLLERYKAKKASLEKYIDAYREYCWTVNDIDDYRIAPFHILACENNVFSDKEHIWHMENIKKYIANIDPIFIETPYICIDTENNGSVEKGINWWLNMTSTGGEGMVVKPNVFTVKKDSLLLQPAIKCRGREYLRIIYGPEYTDAEHMKRLKIRSLKRKRALALKEFSLGMESLTRFVNKEPLYKIHECVFGVLALESEPVDPRL